MLYQRLLPDRNNFCSSALLLFCVIKHSLEMASTSSRQLARLLSNTARRQHLIVPARCQLTPFMTGKGAHSTPSIIRLMSSRTLSSKDGKQDVLRPSMASFQANDHPTTSTSDLDTRPNWRKLFDEASTRRLRTKDLLWAKPSGLDAGLEAKLKSKSHSLILTYVSHLFLASFTPQYAFILVATRLICSMIPFTFIMVHTIV